MGCRRFLPNGEFTFNLANGIYDFRCSEGEYNIDAIEDWNVTNFIEDTMVNYDRMIEPVSVQVFVCLSER